MEAVDRLNNFDTINEIATDPVLNTPSANIEPFKQLKEMINCE